MLIKKYKFNKKTLQVQ